jgi:hypothetical protein
MASQSVRGALPWWVGCLLLTAAGCGTTYPLDGWQISPVEATGTSGQAGRGGVPLGGRSVPIAGAAPAAGRSGTTAGRSGSGGGPVGSVAGTGTTPPDRDRDGFPQGADCDDLQPGTFPGAPDACCDGVDNDCDGNDSARLTICECAWGTLDRDGDGFFGDTMGPKADCDDFDPSVYPFAPEVCGDGRDGNCNGLPDQQEKECLGPIVEDRDGDGYVNFIDCNDFDSSINQGSLEVCGDGIDNDCDGRVDPGCEMPIDFDRDGFAQGFDCNDWDNRTFPGSSDETCCDSVDSDCDGQDDPRGVMCNCFDSDGDGFVVGPVPSAKADCNDQDPAIFPGARENCSDRIDNDCDRRIDNDDSECRFPI